MAWKSFLIIIIGSFMLAACTAVSTPTPAPEAATEPSATTAPATSSPTENAPPGASPANTPASSAATNPENIPQGGTLVRLYTNPPTLDPHLTTDEYSSGLVQEIFGGLVTLNLEYEPVPDLAERWDISDDGLVYTFHLRQDAKFHNGKPVTAQDVKWSLERVTDPETQAPVAEQYLGDIVGVTEKLNGQADSIQGVRVIDDRTIEITIDAPKSYFLAKMSYPTTFVLDRENVEGNPDWLRQPNGTGPFKLAQYDVGQTIRLVRNENYHLGPPHLDEIRFILSGGSPMLMYENDEIDITGVGLADLARVKDPNEPLNAELHEAPAGFSVSYIGMDVNQPPFDDPKVRMALNLAINKEAIAENVLENLASPAKSIIPPGFPSYNPDLQGYEYNPERARQLLAESKYGSDMANFPPITLNTAGSFGANVPLDLEVILQSWQKELGIQVDIQQTEWATFLQDLHARKFQMFVVTWGADYPDPQDFLDVLFHSESQNNHGNYSNPEVDALLEKARVMQDQEARFELYNQIEQMILNDAPWIPLWNSGESYALIKPEVKGYHLTAMSIPKYRHVYIEN
jgi:oligopeptide transport system substrate-binding protein